jgi:hypothetical protein
MLTTNQFILSKNISLSSFCTKHSFPLLILQNYKWVINAVHKLQNSRKKWFLFCVGKLYKHIFCSLMFMSKPNWHIAHLILLAKFLFAIIIRYSKLMSKLINAEVTKTSDVSEIVTNYIITQTSNDEPPFELPPFKPLKTLKEPRYRRSNASGWRALINLHERKLVKESMPTNRRKTNRSFRDPTKVIPQTNRNDKKKTFSVR